MQKIEIIIINNESLKNTAFGSLETCKNVQKFLLDSHPNIRMTLCNDEFDLDETEQVREPSKQELAKFKKMDNEDESDDFDEIEKEV